MLHGAIHEPKLSKNLFASIAKSKMQPHLKTLPHRQGPVKPGGIQMRNFLARNHLAYLV